MDMIQWLLLISENALQTITQVEQLVQETKQSSIKLLPILEQNQLNLNHTAAINSTKILFAFYALIGLLNKKPQLIAAFFISCLFFECSLFNSYSEAQLYLLTFVTYSYVMTCNVFNIKTKLACGIMCLLCLVFAYDAAFYGVNGFYGTYETGIYNNIERLVICCHTIIILSVVDFRRIINAVKSFCCYVGHISRNSATFTIL